MPRQRKGIAPISPMMGIIVALVGISILIAIWSFSIKGKAEEYGDSFGDAAGKLAEFGCENINKQSTGSVTFDDFLFAMWKVYNACGGAEPKCGSESCETMTLDLGGVGKYYKIDKQILKDFKDNKLDVFNNWVDANIYCEGDDVDWGDNEIDAYYSGGTYTRSTGFLGSTERIKVGSKNICQQAGLISTDFNGATDYSLFAVASGSKITIKAKKHDNTVWSITGTSVDLKVKVDGGTFTTPLTYSSSPPECTGSTDTPCNTAPKQSYGYCDSQKCAYNYYCAKRSSNTRCKQITLTCPVNDALTATVQPCKEGTTVQPEYLCSAQPTGSTAKTFKTKMLALINYGDAANPNYGLELQVTDTSGGATGKAVVRNGNEFWFYKEVGQIKYTPDSLFAKPLKLSVMVWKVSENPPSSGMYDVKIYQGCY